MDIKWDIRFLKLAHHIANWSKDPSTQNCAIIVSDDRRIQTTGYNAFPEGIEDTEERLNNRELKLENTIHAEVNAVVNAARDGVRTKGCTMYCTWPPCAPCALIIINAGIKRLVTPAVEVPERWKESCDKAEIKLVEAGVEIHYIEMDE